MRSDYFYLASASPRRQALLAQIGVTFKVRPVTVDEAPRDGESPQTLVRRLAAAKATGCWRTYGERAQRFCLGADTVVVHEGDMLGKPRDEEDGLSMLRRLSGGAHDVLTAVCLQDGTDERTLLSASRVEFREIADWERQAYWDTGEPADKAGSYAVQGRGAIFVSSLEGSYSGVMGLPLFETARLLREVGIKIL